MPGGEHDDQRLISLLDDIYGAVTDGQAWDPLALKIAAAFDASSCVVKSADTSGGGRGFGGLTPNFTDRIWADYEAHYHAQDQWLAANLRRPNEVIMGHEEVPEDWYLKSEFYNDFCPRAGIHDVLSAAFPLEGNMLGMVSVHRPKEAPRFSERERAEFARLVPHLSRVLHLTNGLSALSLSNLASLDALERSNVATIALARNGLILFANRAAERLLQKGAGLSAINGRLSGTTGKVTGRLVALLHSVTAPDGGLSGAGPELGGGITIPRGEGRLPISALVVPFRPKLPATRAALPAALVFITDPETATIATESLQDLFGLTPAQAAVARCLAEGDSLEMIGQKLRISLHTARGHLKAIFAKTETSRQPQLVALLLRTVARLARP